jgi:hypothetical protein
LGCGDCCQSFVLGLLAGFTTLGFVFQTLVVKENLFPRGPNEILVTVDAFDCAVLVLTFRVRFQGVSRFRL